MYIDPLLLVLIITCDLFVVAYFMLLYRYLRLQKRGTGWLIYPLLVTAFGVATTEIGLVLREASWLTIIHVLSSHIKP